MKTSTLKMYSGIVDFVNFLKKILFTIVLLLSSNDYKIIPGVDVNNNLLLSKYYKGNSKNIAKVIVKGMQATMNE